MVDTGGRRREQEAVSSARAVPTEFRLQSVGIVRGDVPLHPADLPEYIAHKGEIAHPVQQSVLRGETSLSEAVDQFEQELIRRALEQAGYNQTRAAQILGTTRRILKYKMDKLGIRGAEESA